MVNNNPPVDDPWQDDFVLFMDSVEASMDSPPAVGETPKDCIYNENKLNLYRYRALNVQQKQTPILFIYALVNRPYIVDLEPDRSLVLRLLEKGYPVYIIDWGYPDSSDCFTDLNDYINGYIHRCVKRVCRDANVKKIDLLGICQGGVFSLCYSALHPANIRKIVTLVTPVDFYSSNNVLSLWTRNTNTDLLFNKAKNISGQLISQLFRSIKPFQLNREKYRHFNQLIQQPNQLNTFLRMEKWLNDCPDLTGTAAKEFIEKFYLQNGLHEKKLSIGTKTVDLTTIKAPVLNLFAKNDHIVPTSSSKALGEHINTKLYQEHELPGGHIGAFTSLKTQSSLIKKLTQWLR